ncbi:hypothetical protein [Paraburkholderia sp. MM5477-R1]|uniref:hypothetical protein n=1 Tax=Paraburkholderia sp. MM5477-R1 TaxID=2991062 RepID=UPI003D1E6703
MFSHAFSVSTPFSKSRDSYQLIRALGRVEIVFVDGVFTSVGQRLHKVLQEVTGSMLGEIVDAR